jgi:hypothetical protein
VVKSFEDIEQNQILTLKPGDILTIKIDSNIWDFDSASQILEQMITAIPEGVNVMTYFNGIEIGVIKNEY